MHKIISDNGIFKVKEVDANGNSVQIFPKEFVTEADAQAFIDDVDNDNDNDKDLPVEGVHMSTNQTVEHQSPDQTMGARTATEVEPAPVDAANTEAAPQ